MFCSFSLKINREISFFSKKTAQLIKETINPPKKCVNSYSIFYSEIFPTFKEKNLKITEIAKIIGNDWIKLDCSEKLVYKNKAEELKKRYEIDHENFNSSLKNNEKLALSLLQLNHRAESGIVTRKNLNSQQKDFLKSMPESTAFTPRGAFLSQRLKGSGDQSLKLSDAMKDWSNLSANEQQNFKNEAQINLENYKARLVTFLKQ